MLSVEIRNSGFRKFNLMNSTARIQHKGQVTIPAHLRAKYGLHPGDEVEVVEIGGTLQIVRAEGAESRGQRLVRRLRNTATGQEVAGMSTDQIMALLRGE